MKSFNEYLNEDTTVTTTKTQIKGLPGAELKTIIADFKSRKEDGEELSDDEANIYQAAVNELSRRGKKDDIEEDNDRENPYGELADYTSRDISKALADIGADIDLRNVLRDWTFEQTDIIKALFAKHVKGKVGSQNPTELFETIIEDYMDEVEPNEFTEAFANALFDSLENYEWT